MIPLFILTVLLIGLSARVVNYRTQAEKLQSEKQQLDKHHTIEKKELELKLQKTQEELEKAKQAKAERDKKKATIASLVGIQTAYAAPASTTDPKLYIYNKESGNNPTRYNSAGCVGLGQACPGSKLLAVCPSLDYACEDAWFTNYAVKRYGSWQGAYNFWIQNHWW